jgi:hypothetical protein
MRRGTNHRRELPGYGAPNGVSLCSLVHQGEEKCCDRLATGILQADTNNGHVNLAQNMMNII